jgi:hypothetical protein
MMGTFFHVVSLEELEADDGGHDLSETGDLSLVVFAYSDDAG